jgi:signal transduction histidine kinase
MGFFSSHQKPAEPSREKVLLDTVIGALQDAVIAYDEQFTVMIFNKTAEALFGIRSADIIGKKFDLNTAQKEPRFALLSQIIYPSLAPVMVERSEPGEGLHMVDVTFENPYLELRVVTVPMIDGAGNETGTIKVVRDLTRQIQLLKSKNEFITVASHQLRTPLTAINWVFQEVSRAGIGEAERVDLLKTGAAATSKLSKIVNDFLDIAKMEEGKYGYQYQETDIVPFIQRAVEAAQLIAKQYKINVYFEKPKGELKLPIDVQKIGIVLSNLIDNAIKYNVEDGSVTVRIQPLVGKPYVEISIEDTGVGVSPEDISKLFTKFFRAESTMKLATEGSGLGLYLVKNIIEQHGGKIWAESTLGRGTKMMFILPTDKNLIPKQENQVGVEG